MAQLEIKVTRLEMTLKEKSAQIQKLQYKNRYLEHVVETQFSEAQNTENPSTQEDKEDQPNSNVKDFILQLQGIILVEAYR